MKVVKTNNQFIAYIDDNKAGLIEVVPISETAITLAHTEVGDDFRGMRVGQTILEYIIDYARDNSIKLMPLCPFTKAQMDKHPEFHDVLYES
ncbi:MAG TPA: N-acetyltransferase [Erysipelothrix sp.]|nr:N-acetyltransferase [Erysipelothrix sp.]